MTESTRHIHSELVARCQKGDRQAQRELYEAYSRAMFNLCTRMLSDRDLAQDCLQEAFIDAFRNLPKFEGKATFGAWLKRITVNKCLTALRKRNKVLFVELDAEQHVLSDASIDVELGEAALTSDGHQEDGAEALRIHEAIKALPAGCRSVFTLYAIEEYKHKEIAEMLDVSVSTSKSQYNRARKLLQAALQTVKP